MTPADIVLTAVLVVAFPAYALADSIVRRGKPARDRVARYRSTIVKVAILSMALTTIWAVNARTSDQLGMGTPGTIGWILLGVATAGIGIFVVAIGRARPRTDTPPNSAAVAMMPVGPRETRWFLVCTLAVGAGWEVLYRGYLLWALAPLLGTVGALLVMGLSYGIAHGYRGPAAFIGSIVSALLFAGAYALTHSLWWLIVIHIGLPLVGLRASRRTTP